MVKDHSDSKRGNPLPPLYGLRCPTVASVTPVVDHWLEQKRSTGPPRWIDQTTYGTMSRCSTTKRRNPLPPMSYSFRLAARVLLYAPSNRQDKTYHSLCYTVMEHEIAQWVHHERISQTTHRTMSEHSYHGARSHSCEPLNITNITINNK